MWLERRFAMAWLATLALSVAPLAGCGDGGGTSGGKYSDDPSPAGQEAGAACAQELPDPEVCKDIIQADCADDDSGCMTGAFFVAVRDANPHSLVPFTLARAHKALQANDAEEAKEILEDADVVNANNAPETYTYAMASIKVAIDSIAPLISFVTGSAPGWLPAQTDQRGVLESLLDPIIAELEDVESSLALIVDSQQTDEEHPGDTFVRFLSLPVDLDLSDLDDSLPADLDVDLKGEWDRVELLGLHAIAAGLLGTIDFILAHNLSLDINDLLDLFDELSTAAIAGFVVDSPELLVADRPERLDSAEAALLTVLTTLVGSEGAGAGKEGLLAAIEAELESGEDQSDDFIQFVDVDGDGKASDGDQVVLTVVEDLAAEVGDIDGDGEDDLTPADGTIDVGIGRGTWVGLTDLGRALVDNMENGGEPVGLKEYLSSGDAANPRLWEELQEGAETELEPLQDWLFVDVKTFFANFDSEDIGGLRGLLPAVYKDADGNVDVAFECEVGYTAAQWETPLETGGDDCESGPDGLCFNSIIRLLCGTGEESTEMYLKTITFVDSVSATTPITGDVDSVHFVGMAQATSDAASPASTETELQAPYLAPLAFHETMDPIDVPVGGISADNYGAVIPVGSERPHNDINLYLLLQDPSMAGGLYIDLDGDGQDIAPATHQSLNDIINKLWALFGDDISEALSGSEE